jgi:hypothetical protein
MIKNFLDDIFIIEDVSSKEFDKFNDQFKLLNPYDLYEVELLKKLKKRKIKQVLCTIGIVNIKDIKKNRYDKVIGIYNKNKKTSVLFKKEIKYQKKYNDIKDLVLNPNICFYLNSSEDNVEITCYNKINQEILFFGKISNIEEYDDLRPYNCSFIESVAAIKDINAKNIVYPLLGYYSNNNLIICDRNIITHRAKSVWLQFFKDKNYISKYLPVDNLKLTTDLDYSLISYYKCKKIKKIKNLSLTKRQRKLLTLKKEHYLDWVFKLNSDFIQENKNNIEILLNRHVSSSKLEKKINTLSDSFFHKLIYM